ncbi:MAG: hypothetical protein V3W14_00610 [Candidatus Neomarinimicrobiota bacterium]
MKAWALTALAVSAARAPVCTLTCEKSWPKRGSMKARVAGGRGWPRPRKDWMRVPTSGVTSGLPFEEGKRGIRMKSKSGSGGVFRSRWTASRGWGLERALMALTSGAPALGLGFNCGGAYMVY